MRSRLLIALAVTSALLSACGVADQPTGLAPEPSAEMSLSSSQQMTPSPPSPASQTSVAFEATLEARRKRIEQTAHALGPAPTRAPTTPDLRPTKVPSSFEKLPGGGYLMPHVNYPVKHPYYTTGWTLDLPDQRQIQVYAGGYIYPLDNYGGQELLKPELGAFSVQVFLPLPPATVNAKMDKSDPRNTNVKLPVRDGMVRIVDALVTDDKIMVMLRTDGSAYTYEVNSHTLAPARPPSADAGGPYTMLAGNLLDLTAQGHDAAGALFDYAWDLDGDGVFEAKGQRVTFSARGLSGPQERTVRVRVTARSGLSATAEAKIAIQAP